MPAGLADALQALVAVPVDAAWQANALLAKLAGPENDVIILYSFRPSTIVVEFLGLCKAFVLS